MTVANAIHVFCTELNPVVGDTEARSCAKIVLEKITAINRKELLFAQNHNLTTQQEQTVLQIIQELKTGKPLQYVLNEAWFFDLPFFVDENVLIPRPETEELVALILAENANNKQLNVLDIGTGSGCIAIALGTQMPAWKITGIDVSVSALNVAQKNALNNRATIAFHRVDVLNTVQTQLFFKTHGPFDVIVSNPPYITQAEKKVMESNVLDHEPHLALFAHTNDALIFYRAINKLAWSNLENGGRLYYEINEFQHEQMLRLMHDDGFKNIQLHNDINNKPRIIKATK